MTKKGYFTEESAATDDSQRDVFASETAPRTPRASLLATVVLSAALGAGAPSPATQNYVDMFYRRREELVETTPPEVDRELLREVSNLFESGATEFFIDGVQSEFSRSLLRLLAARGVKALIAIEEYLFAGRRPNPDVVSESLRWLSDFGEPSTLPERWSILQRTLKDRSAKVRDGAILGFGRLDDPRSKPLLLKAKEVESIAELRRLIDQVISQLDQTANAAAAKKRP